MFNLKKSSFTFLILLISFSSVFARGKQDIIEDVRYSDGVKEVVVKVGDREISLAIVHGLANAPAIMEKLISGEKYFDFIEVMACPGGCVNGGGQSFVDYNKVNVDEVIKKRSASIYKADGDMKFKDSSDNQGVAKVYEEVFKNDKHLIHELLHYTNTDYTK
jgi:iron only hydrogenase large subunit-like protein